MYRAIARCAKVEVFPEPMYDYRIHTGSTMKSGIAEKNLVILDVGGDVTRFIAETVTSAESRSGIPAAGYIPEDTERHSGWRLWQLSGGSGTDRAALCRNTGRLPGGPGPKRQTGSRWKHF